MHRLVEIGTVRSRSDGHELATFQQLIGPQILIPQDVQQVHGITDHMVRGYPSIEYVLPRFIEFLGKPDTILLAHNTPFDLGFSAMALIRLGITYPTHHVFDTLDIACRLYPTWPSPSLEHVASRLNVTHGAEHLALFAACLVKDVILERLQRTPTVTSKGDLVPLLPPHRCRCANHLLPATRARRRTHLLSPRYGRVLRPCTTAWRRGRKAWSGLFQPHILIGGRIDIERNQAEP
jgi:DNA polymerase III epsilon subunit-like protein